jgi:hypothetical protein
MVKEIHGTRQAGINLQRADRRELDVLRLIAAARTTARSPKPVHQREDGQDPHYQHLEQAQPVRPHPGRVYAWQRALCAAIRPEPPLRRQIHRPRVGSKIRPGADVFNPPGARLR